MQMCILLFYTKGIKCMEPIYHTSSNTKDLLRGPKRWQSKNARSGLCGCCNTIHTAKATVTSSRLYEVSHFVRDDNNTVKMAHTLTWNNLSHSVQHIIVTSSMNYLTYGEEIHHSDTFDILEEYGQNCGHEVTALNFLLGGKSVYALHNLYPWCDTMHPGFKVGHDLVQ
jgi:hypothetical protein